MRKKQPDSIRFSSKGQVVIPRRIRKLFRIEAGTRVAVAATSEGILLTPITATTIERGFGLLATGKKGLSFAEEWARHKREELELENRDESRRSG